MNKVKLLALSAAAVCMLTSTAAGAVPCRSGTAVTAGSQTGYTVDVEAANQVQQNNKTSSDALGQCVAAVVNLPTLSTFPSLSEIFDQVRNQICTAISNEVNSTIQAVIPPIPTFPTIPTIPTLPSPKPAKAMSAMPSTTSYSVPAPTQSESTATPASADFYRHIWR